ncbi:hypothetical protein [Streptomyces sp. NPDC059247]|uniref:hypothetical protein n=1 Tax=Streptomyces sp. NPDC059247 TaxID=3346790 RepID=UPI0036CBD791
MSDTEERLTRQQIGETVEALDNHTVERLRARLAGRPLPSPDDLPPLAREAWERARAGTDDDYSDLPQPVLQVFEGDKGGNGDDTTENCNSTKYSIHWYLVGTATKEQILQQLKDKDDQSVASLQQLLDKSRGQLETELEGLDRTTQDHAHDGRATENTHLDDHWGKIIDNVENWFDQTDDEIDEWFDTAATAISDFFENAFGF